MESRENDLVEALRHQTVLDVEGEPRQLGAFWRDRPAVLVFVRHFG